MSNLSLPFLLGSGSHQSAQAYPHQDLSDSYLEGGKNCTFMTIYINCLLTGKPDALLALLGLQHLLHRKIILVNFRVVWTSLAGIRFFEPRQLSQGVPAS